MNTRLIIIPLRTVLTVLLLSVLVVNTCRAEVGPDNLRGDDKEQFERFRDLMQNGSPDDFYTFAARYEDELKQKGYMMLYYKLKNNEGFFALRHNMVLRAMQAARELDEEMRHNGATEYFYLATGLLGDIYAVTQNRAKAEDYFTQALQQVGDADPKFTMRTYQSLAELLCVKNPQKAMDYANESLLLARKKANVEYQSLALAMLAYIQFLDGNISGFYDYYEQYVSLSSNGDSNFSHRYDNLMEIAKLSMSRDYSAAQNKLREGDVRVDSSLVGIRIVTLESGDERSFQAVKNRVLEVDSVHALIQNASIDQMAFEQSQMASDRARISSRTMWIVLMACVVLLLAVFAVGYWWLRRRLAAQQQAPVSGGTVASDATSAEVPLGSSSLVAPEALQDFSSELTEVSVNSFCRELLRQVKREVGQHVELRFTTKLSDSYTIETQADYLSYALTCLLHEAVSMAGHNYVLLRCEQQDAKLLLTVSSSAPSYVFTISFAG